MSDEAVAWKLGFGALVLAFCGVTVALRKPPPPLAVERPPAATAPAAVLPAPDAIEPASAPLDVQEDAPARIEVTLSRPKAVRKKPPKHAALRQAGAATHAVPPRLHRVVATRSAARSKLRAHYPYDPRERWAWRESP